MRKATLIAVMLALAGPASAQGTTENLTARLRAVLPAAVAERVIATVSEARERDLPARALEQRALMLARKATAPASIASSVAEQSRAMSEAKAALARGRSGRPADDEVVAGSEAIRKGVTGAEVSELARTAPSGRSLAVPLFVIGSLVDRGLPSDDALASVLERMNARATDAELARIPEQGLAGRARGAAAHAGSEGAKSAPPPARGGRPAGGTTRGGRPANVPPAGGGRGRPSGRGRP